MAAACEMPLALPHPALPRADWADRFGIEGVAGPLTARQALERMTASAPNWIGRLMALRNGLVHRHNALGRVYIAVITPFHKAIVARMLRSLAS